MFAIQEREDPEFKQYKHHGKIPYKPLFNYNLVWNLANLLMAVVALVPLISIALIDYNITEKALKSEGLLKISRVTSNLGRTLTFFLEERKAALSYIIHKENYDHLIDRRNLEKYLDDLKESFGGFSDLSVIDSKGFQTIYVGPFGLLEGKDYSEQEWFKVVVDRGVYISDVFMGYRKTPHFVISFKKERPDGSFFVLRASIDISRFNELISKTLLEGAGDIFIINRQGILQTPSNFSGNVLQQMNLPILDIIKASERSQVIEIQDPIGKFLVIGYNYIQSSPFILTVAIHKDELMKSWYATRVKLIGFLVVSATIILLVVMGVTTHLIEMIFKAEQRFVSTLHEVENSSKMASIGRLAAGVAHEINNPLAIINEKAGYINDLFTLKSEYSSDNKLTGIVKSIISSVERCGAITKRLLSFAHHSDITIKEIDLENSIYEVLGVST